MFMSSVPKLTDVVGTNDLKKFFVAIFLKISNSDF